MTDDQKLELTRAIKSLAERAADIAKVLEKHRATGVMTAGRCANHSIGQIAVTAQDFSRTVDSAIATLPAELRKAI
jgi:hypothetical protein